jgi:serine/threonine-protein kinase
MGEVVRATDTKLLREVAIKKVHDDLDEETLARFQVEARIGGQLDHPGVLPVYDLDQDEHGTPFFTMKLVTEHRSLASIIDALRARDPATVAVWSYQRRVGLMQQVCRAVDYAHSRGVIHRDLKPQNLVVGTHGEVYVVDWGIARLLEGRDEGGTARLSIPEPVRQTLVRGDATGLVGTPAYMAPEHLQQGRSDERTDTWSLSVVLYEFLTLHHPLGDARSPAEVIRGFATLPVRDAETFSDNVWGRVPRALSRVAWKGLRPSRPDRFDGPLSLERALQTWIEGASPIVCPGTLVQRLLRRAIYLIDQRPVVAAAAVVSVFCLFLVWCVEMVWLFVDRLSGT